MKKLIAVIFASTLALTSCGGSAAAVDLNPTEFQAKAKEAGVVLLDVRSAGEFYAGHIEGAINIDVEGMTFDGDIKSLDKDAKYAVYCQSGRRSVNAIKKLQDAGFTNLFNLKNGILDWQGAGLPVVTN